MKNTPPTADRILSILADLYADQVGVKITYTIEDAEHKDGDISQ